MFNAARCNDARRYNAPTSPPGGRMPLVRSDPRADSNSIPLPLPLPLPSRVDRPKSVSGLARWKRTRNWIASIRTGGGEGRRGEGMLWTRMLCMMLWFIEFSFFLPFVQKDSSIFERRSLFTSIHNYSPGIWNNCKVELIKEWKIYNVYLEIKLIKVMFMR